MLNTLQKNSTTLMQRTGDSSIGALQTNYGMQWFRSIQTTDSAFSQTQWDRLELCYWALFFLPNEALYDIRQEMEYKIRYYQELAEYDAKRGTPINPPRVKAKVRKAITRPVFYLPLSDD